MFLYLIELRKPIFANLKIMTRPLKFPEAVASLHFSKYRNQDLDVEWGSLSNMLTWSFSGRIIPAKLVACSEFPSWNDPFKNSRRLRVSLDQSSRYWSGSFKLRNFWATYNLIIGGFVWMNMEKEMLTRSILISSLNSRLMMVSLDGKATLIER